MPLQLVYKSCFLILLFISGTVIAEPSKLTGDNVLILYKKTDTQSKQVAEYYSEKRHVPESQLIAIDIKGSPEKISKEKFKQINDELATHLLPHIKVLVLTWHAPYRVDCMSITSAFTLGFDEKYCSRPSTFFTQCYATAVSPLYNASSEKLRQNKSPPLSIMLSGQTFQQAKQLIDRGISSDYSQPAGEGYFVRTHDEARSTRWPSFKQLVRFWPSKKEVNLHYVDERFLVDDTLIKGRKNTVFYFTGAVHVPMIETNSYLPGAIADHLTSYGGAGIRESGQMKVYRWLEAGVTGSYGTVVEPCNYPEKFSNPQILIPSYMSGETLIESYWKSVQQPGEGIFVGEPLACPWCND